VSQEIASPVAEDAPLLRLASIEAGYGKVTVLRDVNLSVPRGAVIALIGANGAGKTTLMKVATGLVRCSRGSVEIDGSDVSGMATYKRVERGLCLIPEGRGIFRGLTVRENLRLSIPPGRKGVDIEPAVAAFPVLGERRNQLAGTLSGGQQQMLAIARAYLSEPRVILCDELSLGLAPILLDGIFNSIRSLATSGISIVIVEQYVRRVLALADSAYILVRGQIRWNGPASDVDDELLVESYLG
jgi:branched-chain amino acid transport system ATP-binding protein